MGKQSRVHFLTAYIEYLFDNNVRSEYYYLGDASRYLRFLLEKSTPADVEAFIRSSANSDSYKRRIKKTLRKFYQFAAEELGIDNNPLEANDP